MVRTTSLLLRVATDSDNNPEWCFVQWSKHIKSSLCTLTIPPSHLHLTPSFNFATLTTAGHLLLKHSIVLIRDHQNTDMANYVNAISCLMSSSVALYGTQNTQQTFPGYCIVEHNKEASWYSLHQWRFPAPLLFSPTAWMTSYLIPEMGQCLFDVTGCQRTLGWR